jgi:cellulose 1,4-beta-cellobiosidase
VSSTGFLDAGLTNGLTYFYVVTAVNAVGESDPSEEAAATPLPAPPVRPQNLHAYPGDARVLLSWLPSAGADRYHVKRSLVKSGPFAVVAETTDPAYTDTAVVNGTKYWYVVSALNSAGESNNSKKTSATPAPVPPPPTGLTATPGSTAGTILLAWNASPGATAYKVKRGTVSGGPYSLVKKVTTLSFTDIGLASGQRYYYVVLPVNSAGTGAPSAEASAIAP